MHGLNYKVIEYLISLIAATYAFYPKDEGKGDIFTTYRAAHKLELAPKVGLDGGLMWVISTESGSLQIRTKGEMQPQSGLDSPYIKYNACYVHKRPLPNSV